MKRLISLLGMCIVFSIAIHAQGFVPGFNLNQSMNSTDAVAMSFDTTASSSFSSSYRFSLFVDNSTITDQTVVPFGNWGKNYPTNTVSDSIRALIMVPAYCTGAIRLAFGFVAANGNIIATTTLNTLSQGQGWMEVSLPVNITGGSFQSLVIALSYENGQKGTEVVYLQRLSLVYNSLGTVVLDNGSGVSTNGIPAVPGLVSPANSSSAPTSPSLVWSFVLNATAYNVQIATDQNFKNLAASQTGLTSTSYQTQLVTGTYYWRVNASNVSGTSPWSAAWSFTITAPPPPIPTVPTLVSPAIGSTSLMAPITFTWTSSTGATGYQIQIALDANFQTVKYGASITATYITYPYFPSGTTFYWRVQALGASGNSGWSSIWNFTAAYVTGITDAKSAPKQFVLAQNYPNPFNPTTTIRYAIPQSAFVILKVYDVLGREVETLVNEQKNLGNYEVSFDASRLASGIYFYKLDAGEFHQIKKMILMK